MAALGKYSLGKLASLALSNGKLLKTGGFDQHSKHQEGRKDKVDRNTTNRETLNYATQEGTVR